MSAKGTKEVKNADGKLVCRICEDSGIVEIVRKGCKTLIRFMPGGKVEITNIKITA